MAKAKLHAFLSLLDRDPHPTCTICRGKSCTKDLTCDFCIGWSSSQWEAFAKKRTYKERKRSRPSGSLPPATKTSPRAGTSSEVLYPEASSSSLPSGGQAKKGGGLGVHLVLRPVRLPPAPARPRSSERGGSVSGHKSGAPERAPVSSALSGAGEGGAACSQRTPPARAASSVASPRSSLHALRRGESGESFAVRSHSRSSRVSRSSDRGTRKDRGARSRSGSSRGRSRRSRSASRSRSSSRERCCRDLSWVIPPACGHGVTGRGLLTAIGRVAFALARCLGEIGCGLRTATALVGIALDMTGRDLRIATGLGRSVHDPLLVGEVEVTRSPSPLS